MKNWSIGKKLFSGVGALLVLFVLSGALALNSLATVQGNMEMAAGPLSDKVNKASEMVKLIQEARASEKGAIVATFTKNRMEFEAYRDEERDSLKKLGTHMVEIRPLLATDADRTAIDRSMQELTAWQKTAEDIFRMLDDGKAPEAQAISRGQGKPITDSLSKTAQGILTTNDDLMEQARAGGATQYASMRWVMIGVMLFALSVGAVIVWSVRGIVSTLRNTVTELTNGGEQVAAASSQIASTSQSLSQGSSEQAASLEEVSASMEEMTAMTKRNAENSSEATAMMTETVSQVDRSNAALQEMMTSMGAIKVSSEKVAKINKTIDEIAFQTNILALNAAVEAARAGEAGMGFAVVADEVRNLAQRSAVAAKDTAALIEEAIANSNQGEAKLEQVATAIRAITDSASRVKGLVDEVNEASKQQTQGISQVATAVTQVSTVTQTAAASAEESAAAAQELSAQSQTVSDLVKQLQSMVEGGANHQSRPRPRPSSTLGPKPPTPASHRPSSTYQEDPFPMETTGSGSFRSF